jgi:hypothetical protein
MGNYSTVYCSIAMNPEKVPIQGIESLFFQELNFPVLPGLIALN